jgi:hypothetical protein
MNAYYVTAINPAPKACRDPNVRYIADVFLVQVEQTLAWVKQHADEIAGKAMKGRPYTGARREPGARLRGDLVSATPFDGVQMSAEEFERFLNLQAAMGFKPTAESELKLARIRVALRKGGGITVLPTTTGSPA